MSLKTDYHYNEDDFAERGGQLDELTVTITLCEYRNLITEQTRLDMTVDRLQEEKAELEKKLKAERAWDYELNGEKFHEDSMKFILFKNANNGSGTVTEDDFIKDYTCIEYQLDFPDQVKRVCDMLREQLDDDYIVEMPCNENHCIVIRLKEKMEADNAD